MIVETNSYQKTKFMRMCISEAIVALMEHTDFNKLKVSEISKKAGVARTSFYKYYGSPYDALKDYLQIIITEYMEESAREQDRITYMSYEHILYSLNFYDRYADFFLALARQNMHGFLLEGVNQFMEEHIRPQKKLSMYEMYSYAGGLLNTFLKWEQGGKKEAAEDVAAMLYQLYNSQENHA